MFLLAASCNTENKGPDLAVNGIKPDDKLKLAPINDSLVQAGITVFKNRCSSCHTMELEHEGPDISDLLSRRKPAWVLNFLINTKQMQVSDTIAMKVRQRYKHACGADLDTNEYHEAEALLEYLRMYQIWLHEINAPGMGSEK